MPERTTVVIPEDLVRGIKRLEPLPVTAQRLLEMLNGRNVSLTAVAELIEFDQAVAAAVLRSAATMRYAGCGTMTVHEAVMRLGTVPLLDLVLEGYLRQLRAATPLYDLSEQDLWLHGAAAQLAVRALVAERRGLEVQVLAETAALLHDIGKLIMSRYLKADVRDIVKRARARGTTFVEAERDLLGVDHAVVGAAMAEAWQFPLEIIDAIRRHHSAPFAQPTTMLDVVVIANAVAKTIEVGLGAEGLNFTVDPASYARLGIDFPAFGRICLQTEASLQELLRAQQEVAR